MSRCQQVVCASTLMNHYCRVTSVIFLKASFTPPIFPNISTSCVWGMMNFIFSASVQERAGWNLWRCRRRRRRHWPVLVFSYTFCFVEIVNNYFNIILYSALDWPDDVYMLNHGEARYPECPRIWHNSVSINTVFNNIPIEMNKVGKKIPWNPCVYIVIMYINTWYFHYDHVSQCGDNVLCIRTRSAASPLSTMSQRL